MASFGFYTPQSGGAGSQLLSQLLARGAAQSQTRTPMEGLGKLAQTLAAAYIAQKGQEQEIGQEHAALRDLIGAPADTAPGSSAAAAVDYLDPRIQREDTGFAGDPAYPTMARLLQGEPSASKNKLLTALVNQTFAARQAAGAAEQQFQAKKRFATDPEVLAAKQATARAGATNVTTNIAGADKKFGEEFGKLNAKEFFDRRKMAQDAAQSLRSVSEARTLLKGAYTGAGADFIANFGSLLKNRLGIDYGQGDAVANTQAFGAAMATQVATIIKNFGAGTGLSDADREFARRAAAGDVNMDRGAINRVLTINEKASRNVINMFNKEAATIPSEMSPFPLAIELPESPKTQGAFPPDNKARLEALRFAQEAIDKGADPARVRERLRSLGIPPELLDE